MLDFISKLKEKADGSVDTIILTNNELLKNVLIESKRVLKQDGSIWLLSNQMSVLSDLDTVKELELINVFEDWGIITNELDNSTTRTDLLHIVKNKKYIWNTTEFLREVVCPYIANGEKKGWDYFKGIPMRWTGIGNVFFSSDVNYTYALLVLLTTKSNGYVLSNEKQAMTVASSIGRTSDSNETIPNFQDAVKEHITSSEDGVFSFKNRLFMPK